MDTDVSTPEELVRPQTVGPRIADATGDDSWRDLTAELVSGGKSNLTFVVTSGSGERLILRRPPTGKLLPSAHDMAREARIQSALADTDVPVAEVVLLEETGDEIGVPYYVMTEARGHIIRDELPAGFAGDDVGKTELADGLVDVLVALHSVDQEAVGLGDLGKPDGYLERQLRRWLGQSEKAADAVQTDRLPALAERLRESMPTSPPSRITHGDYRLDNCVVDADEVGRFNAVLDWELSTLGDPIADLALSVLYWGDADGPKVPLVPGITREPGWPGPQHLIDRYCAQTGTDPAGLPWYLGFSVFKFAAIAQGVATRAMAGDMAGQDFGDFGDQIVDLVEYGHEVLDG